MKWFKKINRGLILSIAVVLTVAVYFTVMFFVRTDDRAQIKTAIAEFAKTYSSAALPTQELINDFENGWSEEKCDKEAERIVELCKKHYVDNKECLAQITSSSYTLANGQYSSKIPIKELNVDVNSMSNYSFDGDTVSVSAEMIVSYTGPETLYYNEDRQIKEINETYLTKETIVLQKKDGKWKLFYFDGDFFEYDYSSGYEQIGG